MGIGFRFVRPGRGRLGGRIGLALALAGSLWAMRVPAAAGAGPAREFAARPVPAGPPDAGGSPSATLEEILVLQADRGLAGPASEEARAQGVRAFIRAIDRYGDYLRPEVLASLRATESGSYGGVGLEVFQDNDGRLVCIPLAGGPAEAAGVAYGQTLLGVAGHDARILGVEDVGFLLRGEPGTPVAISVAGPDGRSPRSVPLTRALVRASTVSRIDGGGLPGVRIVRFTRRTPEELLAALGGLDLSKGLVIDLRGNAGGDFRSAVKAASLLLDAGDVVCVQRGRRGEKVWRAEGRRFHPRKIVLWQDHLTASAAEVFVAAIAENRQGVSVGQTSFGKGASQSLFELSRGGALLVTTDALVTPQGHVFDGIGLAPNHRLPRETSWSDAGYREKTREIMASLAGF